MSVNRVTLVGNLGADPTINKTAAGQPVATLSVATSNRWTNKSGQKQESTEWHRVVLWGRLAEIAELYLNKGRQVYIEGRIQTRQWQDQRSGEKRYTTEIVGTNLQLLGAKPEEGASSEDTQVEGAASSELEQIREQLEAGGWEPAAHPQGEPGQPVQAQ